MIMMDAEADESTLPLLPYEPAIVKQYRPMIVQRSAFGVRWAQWRDQSYRG
jgi:hypothetical protein